MTEASGLSTENALCLGVKDPLKKIPCKRLVTLENASRQSHPLLHFAPFSYIYLKQIV